MRLTVLGRDCLFVAAGCKVLCISTSPQSTMGVCREYVYDDTKGQGPSHVVSICISDCGNLLLGAFANKSVCCWNIASGEVLGSSTLRKKPTSLAHSSIFVPSLNETRGVLIVADKAGDVSALDTPLLKKSVVVAGHTASVITDMCHCRDLVATCDRDEKVRVSLLPGLVAIKSYCLGHTSVVTSVSFLQDKEGVPVGLMSSGWDHKIILWDPMTGNPLGEISTGTDDHIHGGSKGKGGDVAASEDNEDEEEEEEEGQGEGGRGDGAQGEKTAEGEGEGEGEGAEEVEKSYNESEAGHYPMKIATSEASGSSVYLSSALFSRSNVIKIIVVKKNDTASSLSFGKSINVTLPAPPVDACFFAPSLDSTTRYLSVLLPAPHYLRILKVTYDDMEDDLCVDLDDATYQVQTTEFTTKCIEQNVEYSQQLIIGEEGTDEHTGMKKHNLHRRFNKYSGVDITFKNGAKRSRKRRLGDAGTEDLLSELKEGGMVGGGNQ